MGVVLLDLASMCAEDLEDILVFTQHEEQSLDSLERFPKMGLRPFLQFPFNLSDMQLRERVVLDRPDEDILLVHVGKQLRVKRKVLGCNLLTVFFLLPVNYTNV